MEIKQVKKRKSKYVIILFRTQAKALIRCNETDFEPFFQQGRKEEARIGFIGCISELVNGWRSIFSVRKISISVEIVTDGLINWNDMLLLCLKEIFKT